MAPLKEAFSKGLVTEAQINEAIYGNLRVLLKLGMLDNASSNPYSNIGIADTIAPWSKTEARVLAREATQKSIVLMKNQNSLLPIDRKKIRSIAVIGPSANKVISDWYAGTPPYKVTILNGIKKCSRGECNCEIC